MNNIKQLFGDLIDWAKSQEVGQAYEASLLPPATDEQIQEYEQQSGMTLPEPLKVIYRICNGQTEDLTFESNPELEGVEIGLFPSSEEFELAYMLVPLSQLVSNTPMTEPEDEDDCNRMPGYELGWIGFGDNYGGDNIVLDMSPKTPESQRGRILLFNHEYAQATELAPSLEQYLQDIMDQIKCGKIAYDEDLGIAYTQEDE